MLTVPWIFTDLKTFKHLNVNDVLKKPLFEIFFVMWDYGRPLWSDSAEWNFNIHHGIFSSSHPPHPGLLLLLKVGLAPQLEILLDDLFSVEGCVTKLVVSSTSKMGNPDIKCLTTISILATTIIQSVLLIFHKCQILKIVLVSAPDIACFLFLYRINKIKLQSTFDTYYPVNISFIESKSTLLIDNIVRFQLPFSAT